MPEEAPSLLPKKENALMVNLRKTNAARKVAKVTPLLNTGLCVVSPGLHHCHVSVTSDPYFYM